MSTYTFYFHSLYKDFCLMSSQYTSEMLTHMDSSMKLNPVKY